MSPPAARPSGSSRSSSSFTRTKRAGHPWAARDCGPSLSGGDRYRIDNTPWFVSNLAADDVVTARPDGNGVLRATERLSWAGRLTIRIIPFRAGPLGGDRQAVLDAFAPLGVTGEGIEDYGMVALDVPPEAELRAVKALLRAGRADGRWDYEESCVSDEWIAL